MRIEDIKMDPKTFDFSLKCIPVANKDEYRQILLVRVEQFLRQLRWKAWHFKNPKKGDVEKKETYGFKTSNTPPQDKDLEVFEEELWDLVRNVEFREHTSKFQNHLRTELGKVKSEDSLLIGSDKTPRFYPIDEKKNEDLTRDGVVRSYKKTDRDSLQEVNKEAAKIAETLDLADRIEVMKETNAIYNLKDTKPDFRQKNKRV